MKSRIACGWLGILVLIAGCSEFKVNMDRLQQGRDASDGLIRVLDTDSARAFFPSKHFTDNQITALTSVFRERCNWNDRRGKFIDFYMANENDQHQVVYIYEYFLDCDSLRILLSFDTDQQPVELTRMSIEPIETANPLMVDPMKSILKDKDWEKDLRRSGS